MAFGFIKYIPLPILRGLAVVVALITHRFQLSLYRSVRANLILTKPELTEAQRENLTQILLKNQLISAVDSAKSWAMPSEWSLKQITKIHNPEILQQGVNHPNGLIIIVPHLGAWELMNPWINGFGSPTIMYKPNKNAALDAFILAGRQHLNAQLVPTDATGVKAVFKALKSGGFSVILPDHVPDPSGGVIAPFFGVETLSSTLTPKLAAKTRCALVGLSCIKRSDADGYEIFCQKLDDENLYHPDITIATTALNQAMQAMIEPHFEHYMWGYRRFKATPLVENPYLLPPSQLLDAANQLHARTSKQQT